jgi:hypothetical protein
MPGDKYHNFNKGANDISFVKYTYESRDILLQKGLPFL